MDDTKRWASERSFFDDEEYSEAPIPASTIARYTQCRKPWLAPEFPFHILGDVRDKYILELGCGDGGNSILLALRGARVVGVDISSRVRWSCLNPPMMTNSTSSAGGRCCIT
jgi:SAM-dependent methyltransferase